MTNIKLIIISCSVENATPGMYSKLRTVLCTNEKYTFRIELSVMIANSYSASVQHRTVDKNSKYRNEY